MGNKPQARGREGNKPVSEMRVCATVAEQHNKGVVTPRGISSGQTHVLTLIHDGQQKPAPHNHTEWKKRSLTREPIQVTCLFYDFQEKKKNKQTSDTTSPRSLVEQVSKEKEATKFTASKDRPRLPRQLKSM